MAVDFLGIGVQKGGTTWLYHQLARHPQIAFPRGKEVHYWDTADDRDAGEWIRLLEPPTRRSRSGRPIKTGEITPAYAMLATEKIAAIRKSCPEIRLFISFRNPVERAWSAALMGLARAQMLEHEASDQWFLDHFRSAASRSRGDYVGCLERWWSAFPRDQLLVLFQDDISARPAAVLESLARHLGIDGADFAAVPPAEIAEVVVPGLGADVVPEVPPPLRPSLLQPLVAQYAAEIARLESLTGRSLQAWRTSPAGSHSREARRRFSDGVATVASDSAKTPGDTQAAVRAAGSSP